MARGQVAARRIFVGSSSIALTVDRQNCGGCTEMIRDDGGNRRSANGYLGKVGIGQVNATISWALQPLEERRKEVMP